jgi:hypothetical protein
MLHLIHLEKEKPRTSRRRETIKIRAEINEIETKKNHKKNQWEKRWFLEKKKTRLTSPRQI